jgi:PAS domain S-box-containing protein
VDSSSQYARSRASIRHLVCLIACLTTTSASARTHEIHPGRDQIHAVLPLLAARDSVRFVDSGRYEESATISLPDVPLTFLAAPGLESPPVIVTAGSALLRIHSDLRLEGITFDGASKAEYAIYSQARRPNTLIVEDCRFHNIVGDAISGDPEVTLGWCKVTDSRFHDIGHRALGFSSADMIRNLLVSNSTFHRTGTAIEVTEKDEPTSVRISDVTIHQAREGIVLKDVTDAIVSGVILSTIKGKVVGGSDHLSVLNSCIFDSEIHQHVQGARCLNCLKADPHFFDSESDDFSLLPESPCLWLGEDHTPIGDPRWFGDATDVARSKRESALALRWAGGIGTGAVVSMLIYSGVRRRFRQATLESLRERDARYRAILEKSTEGILFFDPRSHAVVEMNASLVSQLNIDSLEHRNIQVESLFSVGEDLQDLFAAANSDRPYTGQHRLRSTIGPILDAEVDAYTIEYCGESTVCLVTRDISHWKEETRALMEVEERLQHLLRSSPAVLYSRPLDQPFGFSFISASVEPLLGLEASAFLSNPNFLKWRLHMEDLPRVMGEQSRVLRSGQLAQEYRIQGGDGEYRWVRDETFLLRDELGNPSEIVGSIVDVTSRVEAEHNRMSAEVELEEQKVLSMRADRLRSLGEMAAGIAHELNQPLTGIRGYAELTLIGLEEGWDLDGDKLVARQQSIIDQADRMVHIIDHVRLFARQAGNPDVGIADVNDIVQSSIGLLGSQLQSQGIELNVINGNNLPSVQVNPYSLEEVILNLLVNARDSLLSMESEQDGASIEIRTDFSDGHVRISVADNGVGIPEEIHERIWEPFFTTKDPDKGTGLGLSICRSIIEQCAGRLELESTLGVGTTLTILLPPHAESDRAPADPVAIQT